MEACGKNVEIGLLGITPAMGRFVILLFKEVHRSNSQLLVNYTTGERGLIFMII
jgi:hypothetical protein